MDDLHINYYRKLFCDWATAASSLPSTADTSGVMTVMAADSTPFKWDLIGKCPEKALTLEYRKQLVAAIATVLVANGVETPTYSTSEDYTAELAEPIDDLENWKAATKYAGHILHLKRRASLDALFIAIQRCFTYPGVEYF